MMCKLIILLISVYAVSQSQGLKCWTCSNVESNEACIQTGTIENCQSSQGACQNEIRTINGKLSIDKRCKQKQACQNNERQNGGFNGLYVPLQCNADPSGSVCRCCCYDDECNEDLLFCKASKKLRIYEIEFEGSG